MDFNDYAIDYLNNNRKNLKNDFFSITFNGLDIEDIKTLFMSEDLHEEIRNQLSCYIVERHHLRFHGFEELLKVYFLHKEKAIFHISNLNQTFHTVFKNKYKEDINVTERSTLNLFKLFPLLDNETKKMVSIKKIRDINGLNVNELVSNDYNIIDCMLDIVESKNNDKDKLEELNSLLSLLLDFFTKPSILYSQEDTITNKLNQIFSKILKSAQKNNFEELLSKIDINLICGEKNENTRFSELEIALRNFFPSDTLIKNMYDKKRTWLFEETGNIVLRYSASIDLDDYSYIEFVLEDIKNQKFRKGSRFVISNINNQCFFNKYNIVETLLDNGYFIDAINQKHLINSNRKKEILFKAIIDKECNADLSDILNGRDFFFVFSIESRNNNYYEKIKDFIIENKDILFNDDLALTDEGKELIELNFKY